MKRMLFWSGAILMEWQGQTGFSDGPVLASSCVSSAGALASKPGLLFPWATDCRCRLSQQVLPPVESSCERTEGAGHS